MTMLTPWNILANLEEQQQWDITFIYDRYISSILLLGYKVISLLRPKIYYLSTLSSNIKIA